MMKWRNKRVLVTGGTGFVGSHLVEQLTTQGAQVVSTFQTQDPQSYFSIKQLAAKTILSQTDINSFEAVHHLVTKYSIEYIFHLAAQPLVEVAYYNPRQTLATNIMGTVNILESVRLYPGVKAVIVASSDKAYGKLTQKKYKEDSPLKGDHPYDVSKSATDLITLTYARTYQVPAIVTRFGNIYGPGDLNYSRIIPGMMKCVIEGQKLELRSNGQFIRDYLHVRDVVSGYLLLAEKNKKILGEAFNFGSHDTCSVLELIKTAERVLQKPIPYVIKNTAKNEIPYQSLDYKKAKQSIGWQPELTLEKTLPEIFEYYQQIL
jgi:CDP-glucose 4,6-dehydratase